MCKNRPQALQVIFTHYLSYYVSEEFGKLSCLPELAALELLQKDGSSATPVLSNTKGVKQVSV